MSKDQNTKLPTPPKSPTSSQKSEQVEKPESSFDFVPITQSIEIENLVKEQTAITLRQVEKLSSEERSTIQEPVRLTDLKSPRHTETRAPGSTIQEPARLTDLKPPRLTEPRAPGSTIQGTGRLTEPRAPISTVQDFEKPIEVNRPTPTLQEIERARKSTKTKSPEEEVKVTTLEEESFDSICEDCSCPDVCHPACQKHKFLDRVCDKCDCDAVCNPECEWKKRYARNNYCACKSSCGSKCEGKRQLRNMIDINKGIQASEKACDSCQCTEDCNTTCKIKRLLVAVKELKDRIGEHCQCPHSNLCSQHLISNQRMDSKYARNVSNPAHHQASKNINYPETYRRAYSEFASGIKLDGNQSVISKHQDRTISAITDQIDKEFKEAGGSKARSTRLDTVDFTKYYDKSYHVSHANSEFRPKKQDIDELAKYYDNKYDKTGHSKFNNPKFGPNQDNKHVALYQTTVSRARDLVMNSSLLEQIKNFASGVLNHAEGEAQSLTVQPSQLEFFLNIAWTVVRELGTVARAIFTLICFFLFHQFGTEDAPQAVARTLGQRPIIPQPSGPTNQPSTSNGQRTSF